MKKTLIVGTVAYDEIETPTESSGKILGGAGTYIGLSASLFDTQSSIISIVGGDFEKENLEMLNSKGINTDSIEIVPKGKTFYWKGKYHIDWNKRDTLSTHGNLIEDMPRKSGFVKDIKFFEKEFKGILPLEIMIDSRRKNGMIGLGNVKRMSDFHEHILRIPELSSPISIVNLSKFIKQSFYNGNPEYFQLPSSQENTFISTYVKNSDLNIGENNSYINENGQIARITTMIGEIDTERMEGIEASLIKGIELYFPSERFDVTLTGKTLGYLKGTKFLIKNLLISLFLAILLISLMITYLFRSYKMVIISLVPNILPLLFTAGVMGFFNIPIKPSTILVFSIAFGISVDDTIHFLVKYRQELIANNWKIRKSVFASLRETGISMFYTSIVLFFGFSVFMTSSYGGTIALGGLVSTTLLFAMLANLVLLPSLLISLEKSISNKKDLKNSVINLDSN